MAPTLPDTQAAQRSELQAARARKLHSTGPQTNGALTIRLDHLMGAAQWAMDITYIPMAKGFVYLAVVLDW